MNDLQAEIQKITLKENEILVCYYKPGKTIQSDGTMADNFDLIRQAMDGVTKLLMLPEGGYRLEVMKREGD